VSAGVFAGFERDRKADISYKPVGFTARANAEYWGIGMENTFYAGDPRMRFSGLWWRSVLGHSVPAGFNVPAK